MIDRLIAVAERQIGYLEKASNAQLDDLTANAGRKNYTKYARDYKEFTGEDYQGQAWCDMFVDWCFAEAFGVDKAKELLGGFSAYTPTSAQYFKDRGQWHSTPQCGDIVFFKNSSRICHTGIVTKVSGGRIYTIEGNTSGASDVVSNGGGVCAKSYSQDNSRIAGYGRPAYTVQPDVDYVTALYRDLLGREPDAGGLAGWVTHLETGMTREAVKAGFLQSDEYRSKHPGGVEETPVMTYQKWLNAYLGGYLDERLEVDGSCGPKTRRAAVMAMQRYLNLICSARLDIDGIFGAKSKAAYITVKRGCKGDYVRIVQGLLYGRGYNPNGFDGSCGGGCEAAIKAYQSDHGLEADGHCGKLTFASLTS